MQYAAVFISTLAVFFFSTKLYSDMPPFQRRYIGFCSIFVVVGAFTDFAFDVTWTFQVFNSAYAKEDNIEIAFGIASVSIMCISMVATGYVVIELVLKKRSDLFRGVGEDKESYYPATIVSVRKPRSFGHGSGRRVMETFDIEYTGVNGQQPPFDNENAVPVGRIGQHSGLEVGAKVMVKKDWKRLTGASFTVLICLTVTDLECLALFPWSLASYTGKEVTTLPNGDIMALTLYRLIEDIPQLILQATYLALGRGSIQGRMFTVASLGFSTAMVLYTFFFKTASRYLDITEAKSQEEQKREEIKKVIDNRLNQLKSEFKSEIATIFKMVTSLQEALVGVEKALATSQHGAPATYHLGSDIDRVVEVEGPQEEEKKVALHDDDDRR